MLKSKVIDKVSRQVYRRHPDLKGIKPKVQKRKGAGKEAGYVLTYKTRVEGPGGKQINRIVRAVVDEDGAVDKISTSK